jgi:hypothetical protein
MAVPSAVPVHFSWSRLPGAGLQVLDWQVEAQSHSEENVQLPAARLAPSGLTVHASKKANPPTVAIAASSVSMLQCFVRFILRVNASLRIFVSVSCPAQIRRPCDRGRRASMNLFFNGFDWTQV